MTTAIEYALMAGASYISTRPDVNKLPVPQGWTEFFHVPNNPAYPQFTGADGFEAVSFQNIANPNEIVISFAGTGPGSILSADWVNGNIPLASGKLSDQLRDAADYYLEVKAQNPGATISFTGHSLGGGLASLMAVFFGESAFTFDQAPFRNSALTYTTTDPNTGIVTTHSVAQDLLTYLSGETTNGQPTYTAAELQGLTGFISASVADSGIIPNESNVTDINVQGEILSSSLVPFSRIGSQTNIPDSASGVSGTNLHSQALLTAFLQSIQTSGSNFALNDVTVKLPDLLKMIFDPQLFYHDPSDQVNPQPNLLERLVRHQTGGVDGVAAGGDAMVTRFTSDQWQIAQDGGLSMSDSNLTDALIAFDMQKYYYEQVGGAGASQQLFSTPADIGSGSGFIQFNSTNILSAAPQGSTTNVALSITKDKGYTYFEKYLAGSSIHQSGLNVSEILLIKSQLSNMTDWYIQAGSTAMSATDATAQNAFMLGGAGNDSLVAGAGNDLLVDGAGNDTLISGTGNDTLMAGSGTDYFVGGYGNDTIYAGGGFDTFNYATPNSGSTIETIIADAGGSGIVEVGGTQLTGNQAKLTANNTWVDSAGNQYLYTPSVDNPLRKGTLTITNGLLGNGDQIVIQNFDLQAAETNANGFLGIKFRDQLNLVAGTAVFNPNMAQTDQTIDDPTGNVQTITLYALEASNSPQTITLTKTSGTCELCTGADVIAFDANGNATITIPAGQNFVTVTLVDTSNSNSPDTATLTASMTDSQGNIINSNKLAITFNDPNPNAGIVPAPDHTIIATNNQDAYGLYIYTDNGVAYDNLNTTNALGTDPNLGMYNGGSFETLGVQNGIVYGSTGNDLIYLSQQMNSARTVSSGNDTIYAAAGGGTSIEAGNGNNVIYLNGDYGGVSTGNGNNQIYANSQTDLASAISYAKSATATAPNIGMAGTNMGNYKSYNSYGEFYNGTVIGVGNGNNTIVGGAENGDAIITGSGNNTIVCGPGQDTVICGFNTSAQYIYQGTGGQRNSVADLTGMDPGVSSNNWWTYNYVINYQNGGYVGQWGAVPGANTVGGGNDTIYGGTGNTSYYLSNGNNWLDAGGGNDTIIAGNGNNTIFGGTGNDTITLGSGSNYINLESGRDTIILNGGNTTIIGGVANENIALNGKGNNYIFSGSGNTFIYGSVGNDTLVSGSLSGTGNSSFITAGNGNEYVVGGAGSDTLIGGTGHDTIIAGGGNTSIQLNSNTTENSIVYGGLGSDTIVGGGGTEVIYAGDGGTANAITEVFAGSGPTTITGGAGTDKLIGGGGAEIMYSGSGNDTLVAGSGNNTLYGGSGTDILQGTGGNTLFVGGSGNETIIGGSGNNTYLFNPGFGNVDLQNASSVGTFEFGVGITLADLTMTATIDSNGQNALLVTADNGGSITIDGGLNGAINNYVFLDPTTMTLDQMLAQGNSVSTTVAGANGNLIFSAAGNETLTGGTGNDTIYGWGGNDALIAGTGDQTLYAKTGDNTLTGGAGNDTLVSGSGNDTLIAGSAINTLIGGTGNDTFVVNNSADIVQAKSTGSNISTVMSSVDYVVPANVQNLILTGTANLTATGNAQNNSITANSGNDTLIGGSGNTTLIAGSGSDLLLGGNTMVAGSGSDQIYAGAGSATIKIDPTTVSTDIIGGTGVDISQLYQAMGVSNWQGSYEHANLYYLNSGSLSGWYSDPVAMLNKLYNGDWGGTVQQAIDAANQSGIANITYYQPLPVLYSTVGSYGLQASTYYSANNVPVVNLPASANDFQALASSYAQGLLAPHVVAFGAGISTSDLHLTWGQTVGSITGLPSDPQLQYTTLNISWGTNGQSIQVMIPHSNDPLGSSVSGFTFADGTSLSMAQMVGMAPPAPTFDPGVFSFQSGMGAQVINSNYDVMSFGPGITSGNVQLFLQGTDLLVKDGALGDSVLVQNFAPNGASGSQSIVQFQFADGSKGSYVNDGQGNAHLYAYDLSGNVVGDFWQSSNGTYGNDTYNADGSYGGITYNADGSYNTYLQDASGVNYTNVSYAANGTKLSDSWSKFGGSNGSDTFNADGSSSGIAYNANGSYSSYTNDGLGDITTEYFDASGSLLSYTVLVSDGHGNGTLTNFNANGVELGYSVSTNDGLGNTGTTNYRANGSKISDTWTKSDGTFGSDTFNANGTRVSIVNDGHGGVTTTNYSATGIKINDNWNKTNGSFGSDTFNTDGTSIGIANDGQGDITTTNYDSSGNKLTDNWTKTNGSYGSDTFNSDGSRSGSSYNPDGSYSNYTNDGHGNTLTENHLANGFNNGDSWTKADGSYGSDTFSTDGSSSGTVYTANGSNDTYTNDGHGDVTTTNYDASGNLLGSVATTNDGFGDTSTQIYNASGVLISDAYQYANGNSSSDTYYSNGVLQSNTYSGSTGSGSSYYDSNGVLLSDAYQNADGSSGSQIYYSNGSIQSDIYLYADGSTRSDTYYPDGTLKSNTYNNINGYGSTSYYSNGATQSDAYQNTDGSSRSDNYNLDGSGSGSWHNSDGSYATYTQGIAGNNYVELDYAANTSLTGSHTYNFDALGNSITVNYDANGTKLSDTWNHSDGSSGSDTFYADGSCSGTSYSGNGSYDTYINDGKGDITTTNYDASGNELGYNVAVNNGLGTITTTNFDASRNELGYSIAINNGQGNITTTNYDVTGNVLGTNVVTNDGLGDTTSTTYELDGSYQQSTVSSNGSTTTTNYNAATGETTGSVATTGAGFSYTYDNTINVGGTSGVTESVVDYTYADGSTYATDTVYDPNGSYQQSTAKSEGSTTTTNYNGVTGETTGSIATAGAGYIYTYDNTINVGGTSGVTESVVDYTYADGSTYATDTVYDPNGSYQQSTTKGDGSTTSTNYNAATGETTGSVATAGAGYSYTYDNTINVAGASGVTESVVNYTYADGSTYATDTVYDPNGSYQQSTTKGDGSTTTTNYNAATGETTGSVATTGAGYSYTYDNTVSVGGVAGVTESKVDYTYADGSTYATDTVYDPNGSYQQSTTKGDGSTTTTNYNTVTGETTGSVATTGAGYSYTYDNTVNVGGTSGVTESVVDYTYADGSTYATDTVYDPNGSYQQSTSKGDGSTTTTNYNAATGETTGSVATAGAGYSYTYDNTVNVGGTSGVTESVVDYTYADGSTYATDTVYDPNGSYQQSTDKGDGSTTTTNYNAASGETSGSVATAGAGYSYTYDNTINVGGVSGATESQVNYTYTDGATYNTDTVYNADGSYSQSWSNSNGTAGSSSVNASGTLIGYSALNADGTQAVEAGGNYLRMGSSANNNVYASSGNDILIGAAGSSTITTGSGTNIIAFNAGNGQEVVNDALGQNNTLSLGGHFAFSDLALQKNGNDLILDVGATDSITLKNWYAGNQNIVNLQVVESAMTDFAPGSADTLRNSNVEEFNFQALVTAFDQAQAANPTLNSWSVTNSLLDAHLASSNSAALGGDLAYVYGSNGNLTGFGTTVAENQLSSNQFGTTAQTLNPWPTLNTGTAKLA